MFARVEWKLWQIETQTVIPAFRSNEPKNETQQATPAASKQYWAEQTQYLKIIVKESKFQ